MRSDLETEERVTNLKHLHAEPMIDLHLDFDTSPIPHVIFTGMGSKLPNLAFMRRCTYFETKQRI